MDTEKIKQMGRDYFAANPSLEMIGRRDSAFLAVVKAHEGKLQPLIEAWEYGYMEARYAASKEGRAIELLGRVFEWHMKDTRLPVVSEWDSSHYVWEDLAEFLTEIGWKPNTNTQN